jgi:hypothetical protein
LSSREEAIACILFLAICSGQPLLFHISTLDFVNALLFVVILSAPEQIPYGSKGTRS